MKVTNIFVLGFLLFSFNLAAQSPMTKGDYSGDLQIEEELVRVMDLYSQKKYSELIPILKRYTERNPQDKDAQIILIKSFVYSKDCSEALNLFRRVESYFASKDRDSVYIDIVQCLILDKRYNEAKSYLYSVKDTASDREGIRFLLGVLHILLNEYKEAEPLFKELVTSSNVYKTRAAYYLALISQEEKRFEESIKYLELASTDRNSEEGKEATRILNNIADKKELSLRRKFKPFFKVKNSYVVDTNVPEIAENEDENLKYLTNFGDVSMRWGVRTDLELSGGLEFNKANHKANGTVIFFSNYHLLPINSMVKRSEFDANYYDIMFVYVGGRYSYDFLFGKNRISPGFEVGNLNLFNDQFGSFVHQEGSKSGPNFYLTSFFMAPNLQVSFNKVMNLRPYYRLRMDFYHQSIEDSSMNSMSGLDHTLGLESTLYFWGSDTILFRLEYDKNDSEGKQWRYSGLRLSMGLSVIALSVIDLRLLIDYFVRDFSDSEYVLRSGDIVSRSDKRLSLNVGPEFIISDSIRIGVKYTMVLNHSNNVDVYDYKRHLGMFFWEIKF